MRRTAQKGKDGVQAPRSRHVRVRSTLVREAGRGRPLAHLNLQSSLKGSSARVRRNVLAGRVLLQGLLG